MFSDLSPLLEAVYFIIGSIGMFTLTYFAVKHLGEKNIISTILILCSAGLVSYFPFFVFDMVVDFYRSFLPFRWMSIPLTLLTFFIGFSMLYLSAHNVVIFNKRNKKTKETPLK